MFPKMDGKKEGRGWVLNLSPALISLLCTSGKLSLSVALKMQM